MGDTLIIILLVVLDQLSKRGILAALGEYGEKTLLPCFNFSLTYNTGAAWSFLAEKTWGIYALTTCSLLASLALLIYFYSYRKQLTVIMRLIMSLLIAGSIGNLLDRIILGRVIDFIDFYVGTWHFPTFNLADSYLCIAIGLCLVLSLLGQLNLPLFNGEEQALSKKNNL